MGRSSRLSRKAVKEVLESKNFAVHLKDPDVQGILKDGLNRFVQEAGLLLVRQVIDAEVEGLAGKRYDRSIDGDCYRWGSQSGQVYINSQKVSLEKPRVRRRTEAGKTEEVELESYRRFSGIDSMSEAIMARVLAGVSMRRYHKIVEAVLAGHGISKSAVSRKSAAAMAAAMEKFYNRTLDDMDLVVLMIDGMEVGDRQMIVCLGIDALGRKRVLGLRQGATENSVVCRDLIGELIDRGLSLEKNYLFVIDGSKALSKSIKKAFGEGVAIQRCQLHKRRNVAAYLSEEHQKRIDEKLAEAYRKKTHKEAENALVKIHRELLLLSPGAANSLLEGMTQTITLHRLGIEGTLRRLLCTTNMIESLFSSARWYTRNVKRWMSEGQRDRWLITGLMESEMNLKRVQGYNGMQKLKEKLSEINSNQVEAEIA